MIKIGKDISKFSAHSYIPKNVNELRSLIETRIWDHGIDCDLNDIDVSQIEDMSGLFYYLDFRGDVSEWDVSNVVNMSRMFAYSKFNSDISKWNVSNVK